MRDRNVIHYENKNILQFTAKDVVELIKQQNRQLKNQVYVTEIIYTNKERGMALVAKKMLPKNFQLAYYGKVVNGSRLRKLKQGKRAQTHTIEVDHDLGIVGKFRHAKKNYISLGAFITHSSTPNMEIVTDDFDFPVIKARRPIKKNEILSFDYGPNYFKRRRSFVRDVSPDDTRGGLAVTISSKVSWTYPSYLFFPFGWYLHGTKTKNSLNDKKNRTVWFVGPVKTTNLMKKRLKRFFEQLKRTGKLASYRIKIATPPDEPTAKKSAAEPQHKRQKTEKRDAVAVQHRRPRGRAPNGKVWDESHGKWNRLQQGYRPLSKTHKAKIAAGMRKYHQKCRKNISKVEPAVTKQSNAADTKIVYTIAFAWPDGAPWEGKSSKDPTYKSPRDYANMTVEFMRRHRKNSSFILSVHSQLPAALLETFRTAASPQDVIVRLCSSHPLCPTLERLVPLFEPLEATKNKLVVVADIHDGFGTQDKLLQKLLNCMPSKGAALTFWPASSTGDPKRPCLLSHFNDHPRLPLHSDNIMEYHWHFDAGMGVTTESFRRKLFNHNGSFTKFAAGKMATLQYERSAEEVIADMYLARPQIVEYVKRMCCAFVHNESRRSPRSLTQLALQEPSYPVGGPKSGVKLAWEGESNHDIVTEKHRLRFI